MDTEQCGGWLPIIEYSIKTGVSLSTVRRKIKNNSIHHRLEKGKYLIQYGAIEKPSVAISPQPGLPSVTEPSPTPRSKASEDAVKLMTEAFEYALKEKDERIRLLERRTKDLESHLDEMRLLIQVLEEKYEVRY